MTERFEIIPLADHPHNLDAEAFLVAQSKTRHPFWMVFKHDSGFLAAVGEEMSILQLFPTQLAATDAAIETAEFLENEGNEHV